MRDQVGSPCAGSDILGQSDLRHLRKNADLAALQQFGLALAAHHLSGQGMTQSRNAIEYRQGRPACRNHRPQPAGEDARQEIGHADGERAIASTRAGKLRMHRLGAGEMLT